MTILYMDSFDLYVESPPKSNPQTYWQDANFRRHWAVLTGSGAFELGNAPSYGIDAISTKTSVTGYKAGRAMNISVPTSSADDAVWAPTMWQIASDMWYGWDDTSTTKFRMGSWAKCSDKGTLPPTEKIGIFGFGEADFGTSAVVLFVAANGMGNLVAYTSPSGPGSAGGLLTCIRNPRYSVWTDAVNYPNTFGQITAESSSFQTGLTNLDEWHFLDLYVDLSGGTATLKIDGDQKASVAIGLPTSTTNPYTMIGCISSDFGETYDMAWDHFWVTDGTYPTTKSAYSVACTSVSNYGNSQYGLNEPVGVDGPEENGFARTFLEVNGTKYYTPDQGEVNQSAQGWNYNFDPEGDFNPLWSSTTYYNLGMFSSNPDSAQAWIEDDFADITGFGVHNDFPYRTGADPYQAEVFKVTNLSLMYPEVLPVSGDIIFRHLLVCETGVTTSGTVSLSTGATSNYSALVTSPSPSIWEYYAGTGSQDYWLELSDGAYVMSGTCGIVGDPLTIVGLVFAEEYDTSYTDWQQVDGGTSFDSYFVSKYNIANDADKQFQANYVTVNLKNTSDGGAYIRGIWDYANDPGTGRWSTQQQLYRIEQGAGGAYDHFMRRMKIRGNGRVVQYRIDSQDEKPFYVNGWTLAVSGDGTP